MTRLKAVIVVVVVALALAGLASWLVFDYLAKKTEEASSSRGQAVVVAATEIPVGTKLNASHLKMIDWPKSGIIPGSFFDTKAVVERTSIRPLSPGEPIIESKLMPKDGSTGTSIMTYLIPEGHRAVTVGVNEVAGVAGFISPHNKVDLVLTVQPPGTTDPASAVSKIVLQNIPILATGQITEQKEGKPVVVPTVTLDLTPEDAEKLIIASSKGSLQLLLRGVKDIAPIETRGATISRVMGAVERPAARPPVKKAAPVKRAAAPKAAVVKPVEVKPPPPPVNTIEIIKGANRASKNY